MTKLSRDPGFGILTLDSLVFGVRPLAFRSGPGKTFQLDSDSATFIGFVATASSCLWGGKTFCARDFHFHFILFFSF
jgi:hypothetical protein